MSTASSPNLPLATAAMNMMKPYRGKLPLSVATVVVFTVAFIALIYTERLSPLSVSNSVLKLRPCSSARSSPAPTELGMHLIQYALVLFSYTTNLTYIRSLFSSRFHV